jgi:hypothetical protein
VRNIVDYTGHLVLKTVKSRKPQCAGTVDRIGETKIGNTVVRKKSLGKSALG